MKQPVQEWRVNLAYELRGAPCTWLHWVINWTELETGVMLEKEEEDGMIESVFPAQIDSARHDSVHIWSFLGRYIRRQN